MRKFCRYADIQQRILEVYNNDGPGFTDYLMGDPGYLAMVPHDGKRFEYLTYERTVTKKLKTL